MHKSKHSCCHICECLAVAGSNMYDGRKVPGCVNVNVSAGHAGGRPPLSLMWRKATEVISPPALLWIFPLKQIRSRSLLSFHSPRPPPLTFIDLFLFQDSSLRYLNPPPLQSRLKPNRGKVSFFSSSALLLGCILMEVMMSSAGRNNNIFRTLMKLCVQHWKFKYKKYKKSNWICLFWKRELW